MTKLHLLYDMDAVTANLHDEWLRRYNNDYNDNLEYSDMVTWGMHEYVKPECGKRIYHYLGEPGLFRNLAPMPHAIEVIRKIHDDGHTGTFVTSSPVNKHAFVDKFDWLCDHFPFLLDERHRPPVIFTHQKYKVDGDILFDDCPAHLDAFPGISVSMKYAYNEGHGDIACQGWQDFYTTVQTVAEHSIEKTWETLGL